MPGTCGPAFYIFFCDLRVCCRPAFPMQHAAAAYYKKVAPHTTFCPSHFFQTCLTDYMKCHGAILEERLKFQYTHDEFAYGGNSKLSRVTYCCTASALYRRSLHWQTRQFKDVVILPCILVIQCRTLPSERPQAPKTDAAMSARYALYMYSSRERTRKHSSYRS